MPYRPKKRRPRKIGLAPGTLQIDADSPKPRMRVMAYGPEGLFDQDIDHVEALAPLIQKYPVVWLNVDGLGDEAVLRAIAAKFNIHTLALEDVVNMNQRPKVEEYPDHLFVVAHMAMPQAPALDTEQLSVFLGHKYVITFQEGQPGDCFEPVRTRIRNNVGRMRRSGADYLCYSLLDSVVDAWFPILDGFGVRLHQLEESVLSRPVTGHMAKIRAVKWELLTLLRACLPLRDVFAGLMRETHDMVQPETRLFLRDCHDHATRIIEETETYRDIDTSLMELYLSSVSNKMNEIMKVLTVISAIFIPLTFVVGVYGMNFDTARSPFNMPELEWKYGYPFAWGLMLVIAAAMLYMFHRRGWLSRIDEDPTEGGAGDHGGPRKHHIDPYRDT